MLTRMAATDSDLDRATQAWLRRLVTDLGRQRHAFAPTTVSDLDIPVHAARRPPLPPDSPIAVWTRFTLRSLFEQFPRLFVTGPPGSGKAAFLQRTAWALGRARLGLGEPVHPCTTDSVPRYVEWAAFSRWANDEPVTCALLERFIVEAPDQIEPPTDHLRRALAKGHLVVLLDGLDATMPYARQAATCEAIEQFAQAHPSVRIVVTSQGFVHARGPAVGFERWVAEPLSKDHRVELAQRWLGELDGARLLDRLDLHPGLRDLPGSPRVLALLCRIYEQTPELLESRAALFDRLTEVLLTDAGERPWTGPATALSLRARRKALTRLAWHLHHDVPVDHLQVDAHLETPAAIAAILGLDQMWAEDDEDAPANGAVAHDLLRFFRLRAGVVRHPGMPRAIAAGQPALMASLVASEYRRRVTRPSVSAMHTLLTRAHWPRWSEIFRLVVSHARERRDVDSPKVVLELVEELADTGARDAERAALAAECLELYGRAHAPQAVIDAIDALQPCFADPERSLRYPLEARVRFWAAIGAHDARMTTSSRWVDVHAGTYWFGQSPGDQKAWHDEAPGAWVDVPAFKIQRWPVTVAEFAAFVDAGGYTHDVWWDDGVPRTRGEPGRWAAQRCAVAPVVNISWYEARAYCRWLSAEVPGWLPAGWVIRIPTALEWEVANRSVRGGHAAQHRYPWGDETPDDSLACIAEPYARTPRVPRAMPPGVFPAAIARHPRGLWDTAGNVWEWSSTPEDGASEPIDWRTRLVFSYRVPEREVRGGAFNLGPTAHRLPYRGRWAPFERGGILGLRLVAAPG